MAIYHCSIRIIKRSEGRSAVGAAAYRSGTRLVNQWDGLTHDYTKKKGIVHSEILLPPHAPSSFSDRSTLWNSVEQIEKSSNAQLAREIEVAIPNELPRSEQLRLVREYCQPFVEAGMCVDVSIHDPEKEQPNVHAHIMLTLRELKTNGEWAAKCRKEYDLDAHDQRIPDGKGGWKSHRVDLNDWNSRENAELWRARWADLCNQVLEQNGFQERVDHRSYERQGIDQAPTVHMGVAATQMEKRGIATEKGKLNREIAAHNRLRKEIKARLARLSAWSREWDEQSQEAAPLSALLQTAWTDIQDRQPNTRYGSVKALKENASLLFFLESRNIQTLDDLRGQISAMQERYFDLLGEIKADEREMAVLSERLSHWEQYQKYRPLSKRIANLRPKDQQKEQAAHAAELTLYEASARYLADLKEQGLKLTPKRWKAELEQVTAHKAGLYQRLKDMCSEIKAAEELRKAAQKLERQKNLIHQNKERS